MILYFTGTGNSAFIAKRIAEKTGDTAVDVFPMIRENNYGKLSSSRPFGGGLPYLWLADPPCAGKLAEENEAFRKPEAVLCNDLRRRDRKCRRVCKTVL